MRTREILETIIREYATARDEPWLLMHAIRAMGKDFSIGDEPAVAYLCRRYLQETSVNGKSYLHMPISHEGHANAFLAEAVLDSGIDATYAFRTNDRNYSIADLIAGAKARFDLDTRTLSTRSITFNADDLAFSLVAFAYSTERAGEWVNAYGNSIHMAALADYGLEALESANKLFEASMRQGLLAAGPDRIHDFACGGMHLIYGLSTCLRLGHLQPAQAERMKTQFDIVTWRLKSDSALVERHYNVLADQYPAEVVRIHRLSAKLKLLGHGLEVINHARHHGLFIPTAAQDDDIGRAHEELFDVIEAVGPDGPRTAHDATLFKYLVGDACHAYRGVTMARLA